MEKIKAYGSLFLGCLSCFNYGLYVGNILNGKTVEPHRWFLTGLFGLYFIVYSIDKIKKLK